MQFIEKRAEGNIKMLKVDDLKRIKKARKNVTENTAEREQIM